MPWGRPRSGDQTAADGLADDMFRQIEKIFVDCGFLLRQTHGGFRSSTGRSLARIARRDKSRRAGCGCRRRQCRP